MHIIGALLKTPQKYHIHEHNVKKSAVPQLTKDFKKLYDLSEHESKSLTTFQQIARVTLNDIQHISSK